MTVRENANPLWVAAYCPALEPAKNDPSVQVEVPRFRVYPVDGSDRSIAETNTEFSREVQEKCANLIAEALSKAFGGLECGEEAQASYLVTGNLRHFPPLWKSGAIVTPAACSTFSKGTKANRRDQRKRYLGRLAGRDMGTFAAQLDRVKPCAGLSTGSSTQISLNY